MGFWVLGAACHEGWGGLQPYSVLCVDPTVPHRADPVVTPILAPNPWRSSIDTQSVAIKAARLGSFECACECVPSIAISTIPLSSTRNCLSIASSRSKTCCIAAKTGWRRMSGSPECSDSDIFLGTSGAGSMMFMKTTDTLRSE